MLGGAWQSRTPSTQLPRAHRVPTLSSMGAVCGATRPCTAIVMLFELTRDYQIILPLMISCDQPIVAGCLSDETIHNKSWLGEASPADKKWHWSPAQLTNAMGATGTPRGNMPGERTTRSRRGRLRPLINALHCSAVPAVDPRSELSPDRRFGKMPTFHGTLRAAVPFPQGYQCDLVQIANTFNVCM